MDLIHYCDLYGREVSRWPEFAQREGIAVLFEEDVSWLCDSFDQFSPTQCAAMIRALREENAAARLIQLGTILDELFAGDMLIDELQKRVDLCYSGWRRDRDDARGDWAYHYRLEESA